MREFLPIILGSDENAYSCARMFYELSSEKSLLFCSKALAQTAHSGILMRYVIEDFDTQSIFLSVMTTALPKLRRYVRKILLIPCSDYYAELVINNKGALEKLVDSPIINPELYFSFKDKIAFERLCREKGISHPKTEISLPSQIIGSETKRNFPIVMKPANSNSYEYLRTGTIKRKKVYFCADEVELKRAASELFKSGYNGATVLQEYIGGGEEYSRVVNAYCDRNSKVRLVGAGRPLLEYRADTLIGNYAAIKTVRDRELCDRAAELLERIGYVGFANLDVKIDPESGRYYFLELNPRQGRSSYYIRVAGENLMRYMYDDIVLETPYAGRRYAEGNGIWINEPIGVIKREMKRYGLDENKEVVLGRTALDITYDFSIPRAAMLIRRRLGAYLRQI